MIPQLHNPVRQPHASAFSAYEQAVKPKPQLQSMRVNTKTGECSLLFSDPDAKTETEHNATPIDEDNDCEMKRKRRDERKRAARERCSAMLEAVEDKRDVKDLVASATSAGFVELFYGKGEPETEPHSAPETESTKDEEAAENVENVTFAGSPYHADDALDVEMRRSPISASANTLEQYEAQHLSPEPKSAPEPAPEPASEPAPEPAPEPAAEPAPEPAPEPAAEPAPEPASGPAPQPASEPASEPTPDPERTAELTPDANGMLDFDLMYSPEYKPYAIPKDLGGPTGNDVNQQEPTGERAAPGLGRTAELTLDANSMLDFDLMYSPEYKPYAIPKDLGGPTGNDANQQEPTGERATLPAVEIAAESTGATQDGPVHVHDTAAVDLRVGDKSAESTHARGVIIRQILGTTRAALMKEKVSVLRDSYFSPLGLVYVTPKTESIDALIKYAKSKSASHTDEAGASAV